VSGNSTRVHACVCVCTRIHVHKHTHTHVAQRGGGTGRGGGRGGDRHLHSVGLVLEARLLHGVLSHLKILARVVQRPLRIAEDEWLSVRVHGAHMCAYVAYVCAYIHIHLHMCIHTYTCTYVHT